MRMARDRLGRLCHELAVGLACTFCVAAEAQMSDEQYELLLGTIHFPTSGNEAAQAEFELGVLALHSFWYAEARDHFREAQELQPDFGMAWWGEAMTWDNAFQTETDLEETELLGEEAVARMDERDQAGLLTWTERERGYANAVRWRFARNYSFAERRQAYAESIEQVAQRYPDDDEAAVFTELAVMALPGFDREQPQHVVDVASRLEEIYERNREHPGVLHYLIHAYDTATFARMGLRQARIYAEIAPASSHALHMPSHIFRHLGLWDEVVASNEDAWAASVAWQERTDRPLHMRDYHALDWLLDAYINLGRLDDAAGIIDTIEAIETEMARLGEDSGQFPEVARTLREYYKSVVGP